MTTFRALRRTAAATAVVLAALIIPTAPSSADVLTPALPVEEFPGQVKEACGIWKELEWPSSTSAKDFEVADTSLVIRGSNTYYNRSGDLPLEGQYREYDVNPRTPGVRRDAERLVRDIGTHDVWYTGDHYDNFREISSGCP
ncbi:ribonuclease domain-containing protein [Streptomyces xiamenensis]